MPHHSDIAEFQHHLSATLLSSDVASESFVIVKLDDDLWLLDLMTLKEASVPPRIARSVGAPAWMLGVANFKGEVWSVIDMRMVLKQQPTVNPSWGWVTLVRSPLDREDLMVGLLWSEIVEIGSKQEYDPLPSNETSPTQWCRAQYRDHRGKIWKELDLEQIIGPFGLIEQWRAGQSAPTSV